MLVAVLAAGAFAAPALAIEHSGTFIQVPGRAPIYRVIGGAAIHVLSCAPLGGCPGVVKVPNLSGYAATPANGAYMRIADGSQAGWIGVFIGGAAIHLDSCAPLKGCPGDVNIDSGGAAAYISAHPTPAHGSFIRIANGSQAGWIGEIIGGSAIHVDSCTPLGGCPGATNVDAGGAADYIAAHPTPANGSFMRIADGPRAGEIGVFVGGAPLHVDSCVPLDGCLGDVNIDSGGGDAVIAAHPTPTNGSFVLVSGGADAGVIARAAGGALLPLTNCGAIGGCSGWVELDSGGYQDYTAEHPIPVDGTLLLGLPSNTTWEILAGQRVPAPASSSAVALNDATVDAIPLAPAKTSGTGTSQLRNGRHHRHLRQLQVPLSIGWHWNRDRTQMRKLVVGRLPHHVRIRISCSGHGCRRNASAATARGVDTLLSALLRHVFASGDRILFVISAPHRSAERVLVVIRYGRKPLMTRLR